MSRELVNKGHQALVLINGNADRIEHVGDEESVPVYSTHMHFFYWHKTPIRSFIGWLFSLIPTVLRLRRFVKKQNVDVVVVHYAGAWAFYFLLLRLFYRIPYVVCLHGTDVHHNLVEHWSTRAGIGMVMCRSDCLVSCSESLLATARQKLGCKPRRAAVIYQGLNLEWAQASDQPPPGSPYIVSQGLPLEVKGGDILLKAFAAIAPDYPAVRLKIIGRGDHEKLAQLVAQYGLAHQVELAGLVPLREIPTLFRHSLFGVIASRREGLPLAAMELQYLRRPVIASAVGGLPECIEDGVSGFLVPSENAALLAEKMKTLLDDEPLRVRMGEAGRRLVREKFEIGRSMDAYLELFEQIVRRRAQ